MPTRHATPVSTRLPVTWSWLASTAALLMCCNSTAYAAGPTGLLNDTGQTQCDNGSTVMVACTVDNTGDAATYKRQDGRFGRDRAAPPKVGGGVAGFDFTKVCFNGDLQGSGTCTGTLVANTSGTATGTARTDWACTKDNVTNLIWSLQSQSATWDAATVVTYPNAGHNSVTRCGFATGWRLPTRRELMNIVLNDGSIPTIDASYFPSTQSTYYWTGDTTPDPSGAWVIYFHIGMSAAGLKTTTAFVRLVRSGQ